MKITKKILGAVSAAALLSAVPAFAQDASDFGFGDATATDGEESSDGAEAYVEPKLEWSGEAGVNARAWIDTNEGYKSANDVSTKTGTEANGYLKLDLNYNGSSTDFNGKLKLDTATIKDNPEDVLEEVTVRSYLGNWQVEAGKMKNVWGKGDKLHVLDNFNANDYTDFVFPDYIDRRIAEPMFKVSYASPSSGDYLSNIKLEGVYTPMMTADRFASDGVLVPYSMTNLTNTVTGIVKHNAAIDLSSSLGNQDYAGIVDGLQTMSSFSADNLYEDNIKTLKYGQAGARFTATFSGIDFGASYYYGHYKQPSANLGNFVDSISNAIQSEVATVLADSTKLNANDAPYLYALVTRHNQEIATTAAALIAAGQATETTAQALATKAIIAKYAQAEASTYVGTGNQKLELPSLNYDQVQVFGLEAAFVLWKFNTRWEFAYNLTEDTAGDNPWIKNNSIGWVAGFDMDLPIHNLNINVQESGSYVLKNDKIEDGAYKTYDVDYNSDGNYTNNQLVVNVSDKWLYEKLTTECTVIYGIECKEWCVQPKISYNIFDGLTFIARGAYIYSNNENGQFYNFTQQNDKNHNISFAQLSVQYKF
ncbi:hypothetical protein [Treponema zioleckii]|uniref:hypothetical protein n=1 Tax=Treponema zioleckii TaxID=331680 RepID=UPI00168A60E4|nr:hypothetical protein [Treponema zioleckii]